MLPRLGASRGATGVGLILLALMTAVGQWGLSLAGAIPAATTTCAGWTGYLPLHDGPLLCTAQSVIAAGP
ncbi:MAG: hypothetical protein ACYCZN_12395 [Candidatus Dormibacteria bacterium]